MYYYSINKQPSKKELKMDLKTTAVLAAIVGATLLGLRSIERRIKEVKKELN